jgi:hypothetical protein
MRNRTRVLGIAMIVIGVIALLGQLGGSRWDHSERHGPPRLAAIPEIPDMPELKMPEMPEMPAMPEMRQFDNRGFSGFHHSGPWIGGQLFKILAVLLLIGLFMRAKRRHHGHAHDHYHSTIHRF